MNIDHLSPSTLKVVIELASHPGRHIAEMPLYVLRLSMEHPTFRVPSLLSIAQVFGFPIKFISEDLSRGIVVVELEKDQDVENMLERGILIL